MKADDFIRALAELGTGEMARAGAAWAARLDQLTKSDPLGASEVALAMASHLATQRMRVTL